MNDIFHNSIAQIALRSSVVYLCIILFIRIFGKKEISQLSVIDLVFILLISNSVQNAMVGEDTSLAGGLIAALTLFAINFILRYMTFRNKKMESFFKGHPVMLVYEGTIMKEHMDKEEITIEELESAIREHGVKDASEVNLAILETDGNISVLSKDYSHRTVKRRKHHKALSGF